MGFSFALATGAQKLKGANDVTGKPSFAPEVAYLTEILG